MRFKFNTETKRIDLVEDYSKYISDETLQTMSPDNNLPYIQKDQFTPDILSKLDPNRDLKAFQRIAVLAKTKKAKLMLLDFLLGKGVDVFSQKAKEYLLISLDNRPEDVIAEALRGQWPLLEFAKNLGVKGRVKDLPYRTVATIDALVKGKKILENDLIDMKSWLIDPNLYKDKDEDSQVYKIKLKLFLDNSNNLKKFMLDLAHIEKVYFPDDAAEDSALKIGENNDFHLTLGDWINIVAKGDIKNLWALPVADLERSMDNFTDTKSAAAEQARQKEREGKISVGEWLDNNKIERSLDELKRFDLANDEYTEIITQLSSSENKDLRNKLYRSCDVDQAIMNTTDGQKEIAKAIVAWYNKETTSKATDNSLKAFLARQGVDVSKASLIRDKLVEYAKTAISDADKRNTYTSYVEKAIKKESILNNMLTKVLINDAAKDLNKEVTDKVTKFFNSANDKTKATEATFEEALKEEAGTVEQGYSLIKAKLVADPNLLSKFEAIWKTPERKADFLKASVKRSGDTYDWLPAIQKYLNSVSSAELKNQASKIIT